MFGYGMLYVVYTAAVHNVTLYAAAVYSVFDIAISVPFIELARQ